MATATAKLTAELLATQSSDLDVATRAATTLVSAKTTLANGTGNNQINTVFSDRRTLAASANEDLDLSGTALQDTFGANLALTKVKAILIKAAATNTNNVVVKPGASNGFTGPFGAATHTQSIPPGGVWMVSAPLAGWTVTAATADLLNVANSSSGTSVTYEIAIVGVS